MPLYGNFGEDVRDEHDKRPLRRDDEGPTPQPARYPMQHEFRMPPPRFAIAPEPDLATRVAADIFVRWASTWDIPDEFATDAAADAVRLGRIFAEAVAKEGK
jgi:hypothetical protein